MSSPIALLRRAVSVRSHRVLLLAAVTGVVTGAAVAGFEWVTNQRLFEGLLEAPLGVQIAAPAVGLALSFAALATLGRGASPSTSDEYIKNFHDRTRPLDLRPLWGRVVAGVMTLGSGGALGFEGPALYIGAAVGTTVQRRRPKWFAPDDVKVLMVAGAAAGVAAIFKAPATGAVFALEVPYRDDNARHMLLPALLASATGYLTFVALLGTAPLFSVAGSPPFDLRELAGAVMLGLVCGAGARGYARLLGWAKGLSPRVSAGVRVPLAGFALAGLAAGSNAVFGEPLALGSGYRSLAWVTEPGHALGLVVVLFALRLLATTTAVAGGGVGGLFIPLVVAGAIAGSALAALVHDESTLFPLIGVAAFLSAGYRTPLAGIMFVAETTGRPGFVVPGLIAAVASQLVMGDVSVSEYQSSGRLGHLERRFRLPIAQVIDTDVLTAPPDTTLREFYDHHLLASRRPEVPVVDGATFVGMVTLHDIHAVTIEDWPTVTVAAVADPDWPTTGPGASVEDAVARLEAAGVDVLVVVDDARFVGLVTTAGIIGLDQILG